MYSRLLGGTSGALELELERGRTVRERLGVQPVDGRSRGIDIRLRRRIHDDIGSQRHRRRGRGD